MKGIFLNRDIKYALFILSLTIGYGLLFVIWEFLDIPCSGFIDFLILVLQWGIITLASFPLFLLLGINRYVFSVSFPVIVLLSGVFAYFRYWLHITLTPMLIDLIAVNDAGFGIGFMNLKLFLFVLIALLYSLFAVYWRFSKIQVNRWELFVVSSLCLLFVFHGVGKLSGSISQRMPASFFYVLKDYMLQRRTQGTRIDFKGDIHCNVDTLTAIVVLGESLRADHLQLNGYRRNTTPLLASDVRICSFPNVYTKEVFTHTSLPVILTRADSIDDKRAQTEQSFISLFKKVGFRTSWLASQEPVNTYSDFMHEADTLIYANEGKNVYMFDKWLDGALLPFYQKELEYSNPRKLIVLHTIGSHWWYNSHFEKEVFSPVLRSKNISSSTQEAIVNSYDNTILYTDCFLHQLIEELRDEVAILIYLSDHGESLGENEKYLHAEDNEPLHYPAAFVWYSVKYENLFPQKIEAMKRNAVKHVTTSFMFHSILDASSITSAYLDEEQSIFK
mgnify:FL=1